MGYSDYIKGKDKGGINDQYNYEKLWGTFFAKSRVVLDIGCGIGDFIKSAPKGASVLGIDIDKELVKHCKKQGLDVKLGNITKIPFKEEYFDGIYGSHIIEHLDRDELIKASNEMHRILKPGGTAVLVTPNFIHNIKEFYADPTHVSPFTPKRAKILFNNFSKVRVMPNPFYIPKLKALCLSYLKNPGLYEMLLKSIPFRSRKELWIILKK